MTIFILSFTVITITILAMTIAVWCGSSPIKGSCSGTTMEDINTVPCRNCHCEQTNIKFKDNEFE